MRMTVCISWHPKIHMLELQDRCKNRSCRSPAYCSLEENHLHPHTHTHQPCARNVCKARSPALPRLQHDSLMPALCEGHAFPLLLIRERLQQHEEASCRLHICMRQKRQSQRLAS